MKKVVYAAALAAALGSAAVLSSCCAIGMLAHGDGCMGGMDHGQSHAQTAATRAQIGDQVVCAVDGMKMRLTADTPSTEFRGKVHYFCSDSEKQKFLQNPEQYIQGHGKVVHRGIRLSLDTRPKKRGRYSGRPVFKNSEPFEPSSRPRWAAYRGSVSDFAVALAVHRTLRRLPKWSRQAGLIVGTRWTSRGSNGSTG